MIKEIKRKVLILEEAKSVRKSLCELVEMDGLEAAGVESLSAVEENLGRGEAIALLIYNTSFDPSTLSVELPPRIALSDRPTLDEAFRAAQSGASDYITKPYDMNRLMRSVRECIAKDFEERSSPAQGKSQRRRRTAQRHPEVAIVGCSPQVENMRHFIEKIAPTDARVMILGENGTGKELVAHSIHEKSLRAAAPFVEVNCAAIPSELIESELFGHEKGAFTSAIKQRSGKFEQADGGTLFLDEIGDMSLAAQAKVLRALQERKISRVGSDRDIEVDVRVLAATNKDIKSEIAAGNFREDLYHRLSVIEMRVVALRERSEDIPLLVDHFLGEISREYRCEKKGISTEALEMLMHFPWSGNIRQLRNVVERLFILSELSRIESADVKAYVC